MVKFKSKESIFILTANNEKETYNSFIVNNYVKRRYLNIFVKTVKTY